MFSSLNARALGLSLSAEETIRLAASAGFDGVDLMVRDLVDSKADLGSLKATMEQHSLQPGSWPLPVNWRGDFELFQSDLKLLPRYAETAARLGLVRTGTWVMPETTERPQDEANRRRHLEQVASLHVERLGAIARILDQYGIRLGLEVIGVEQSRTGKGWPFLHRLGDLDERIGEVWDQSPNLGIIVDSFQLYAAGESFEAGLAWGVERIVGVHIADLPPGSSPERSTIVDPIRGLPGEFEAVGTAKLLQRMADDGYMGPVMPEPFAKSPTLQGLSPDQAIRRVAEALRRVWPGSR